MLFTIVAATYTLSNFLYRTIAHQEQQTKIWKEKISHNALQESKKGRVVLILCKTEENERILRSYLPHENLYQIEGNGEFVVEPKKIIVTADHDFTNKDLKITKESQDQGGIHIILTYMPEQLDENTFGALSRKSFTGSGEIYVE